MRGGGSDFTLGSHILSKVVLSSAERRAVEVDGVKTCDGGNAHEAQKQELFSF